jgi:hypothetical protein
MGLVFFWVLDCIWRGVGLGWARSIFSRGHGWLCCLFYLHVSAPPPPPLPLPLNSQPQHFSRSLSPTQFKVKRFNLCTNKPSAIMTGKQVLLFYLFPDPATPPHHTGLFLDDARLFIVYLVLPDWVGTWRGEESLLSNFYMGRRRRRLLCPRAGAPPPSSHIPHHPPYPCDVFLSRFFFSKTHGISNQFLYQVSIAFLFLL